MANGFTGPRRSSCPIDRSLIAAITTRLERWVAFSLSVTDRELYLSIGTDTLTGAVTRLQLA